MGPEEDSHQWFGWCGQSEGLCGGREAAMRVSDTKRLIELGSSWMGTLPRIKSPTTGTRCGVLGYSIDGALVPWWVQRRLQGF